MICSELKIKLGMLEAPFEPQSLICPGIQRLIRYGVADRFKFE